MANNGDTPRFVLKRSEGEGNGRYAYASSASQKAGWDKIPKDKRSFTINNRDGASIIFNANLSSKGSRVNATLRDKNGYILMTITKEFIMSGSFPEAHKRWEPNYQKLVTEVVRELQEHYRPGRQRKDSDDENLGLVKDISMDISSMEQSDLHDLLIKANNDLLKMSGMSYSHRYKSKHLTPSGWKYDYESPSGNSHTVSHDNDGQHTIDNLTSGAHRMKEEFYRKKYDDSKHSGTPNLNMRSKMAEHGEKASVIEHHSAENRQNGQKTALSKSDLVAQSFACVQKTQNFAPILNLKKSKNDDKQKDISYLCKSTGDMFTVVDGMTIGGKGLGEHRRLLKGCVKEAEGLLSEIRKGMDSEGYEDRVNGRIGELGDKIRYHEGAVELLGMLGARKGIGVWEDSEIAKLLL